MIYKDFSLYYKLYSVYFTLVLQDMYGQFFKLCPDPS